MKLRLVMLTWLVVLTVSWITQGSEPSVRRTNYDHSLIQVSRTVDEIRNLIKAPEKNKSVYLIGGTARGILDHLLYSKPLKLKDIDIAVVLDRRVKKIDAEKLSQGLEDANISKLKAISSKAWADGVGLFHTHIRTDALLDIGIYPSFEMLQAKNGVLNIERILLEIPPDGNLLSVADSIELDWVTHSDLALLSNNKFVYDSDQGYMSWRNKQPRLILESEVKELPVITTMRIIRNFSKLQVAMDDIMKQKLKGFLSAPNLNFDRTRATRHFTYFFDDMNLGEELKLARELGVVEKLFPSAADYINHRSAAEINQEIPIQPYHTKLDSVVFSSSNVAP